MTWVKKSIVFLLTHGWAFLLQQKDNFIAWRNRPRWKGIAFVGGLEYMQELAEAVKLVINKNDMRFTVPSSFIFSLAGEHKELLPLFFNGLKQAEKEGLDKTLIMSQELNLSLNVVADFLRLYCGKTFLVKHFFRKDLFTVMGYILTPDEAEWLRKKGYFLVYLQSKNPEYITKWCKGYTYGAMNFDRVLFDNITRHTFIALFKEMGLNI